MKQFHYKAYDEEGGIHEGSLAARTKGKQRQPSSRKGCRSSAFLRRKRRISFSVRGLLQAAVRCPFWLRPGQHSFPLD